MTVSSNNTSATTEALRALFGELHFSIFHLSRERSSGGLGRFLRGHLSRDSAGDGLERLLGDHLSRDLSDGGLGQPGGGVERLLGDHLSYGTRPAANKK